MTKARIDILNNALFLAHQPTRCDIVEALNGRVSPVMLPVFLHEGAHHWCLSSPVGTALSMMLVALHKAWLEDPLVTPFTAEASRIVSVTQIFEPLLEGLAQFAEFDVFPGQSAAISTLSEWTALLFCHHITRIPATEPFNRLKYLLAEYRSSIQALRRKSDILVRPLSVSSGGYLLGYLSIKNLWLMASRRSPRLRDTDLFFSYVRNLIFQDFVLVDMLLGEWGEETTDWNNLLGRVHERLRIFRDADDLDSRVADFETALCQEGSLEGHWESIYLNSASTKESRTKLDEAIRSSASQALKGDRLQGANLVTLAHRPLLRIHTTQVEIRAEGSDGCSVSLEGHKLFSTQLISRLPEDQSLGSMAIYLLPQYSKLVFVCTVQNVPVCAYLPIEVPEEIGKNMLSIISHALETEKFRNQITKDLFQMAMAGEPHYQRSLTNMYLNFALSFVASDKLEFCLDRMQQNGFWQLLEKHGDSVYALAGIGLLASLRASIAMAAEVLNLHQIDLGQAMSALQKSYEKYGYWLIPQNTTKPANPLAAIESFV